LRQLSKVLPSSWYLWWHYQKGYVAFQNDLLLELFNNGGNDETNLIKKGKTEQKQAQPLVKQPVKREATTSQE
jgi:hypothetical protein